MSQPTWCSLCRRAVDMSRPGGVRRSGKPYHDACLHVADAAAGGDPVARRIVASYARRRVLGRQGE